MAKAAQVAGEATARRFDTSKEKGSAASAVACFMRDMMTLRRGIDIIRVVDAEQETPDGQPVVQPTARRSGLNGASGLSGNRSGFGPGLTPRGSIIRKPTQIFVDADTEK